MQLVVIPYNLMSLSYTQAKMLGSPRSERKVLKTDAEQLEQSIRKVHEIHKNRRRPETLEYEYTWGEEQIRNG